MEGKQRGHRAESCARKYSCWRRQVFPCGKTNLLPGQAPRAGDSVSALRRPGHGLRSTAPPPPPGPLGPGGDCSLGWSRAGGRAPLALVQWSGNSEGNRPPFVLLREFPKSREPLHSPAVVGRRGVYFWAAETSLRKSDTEVESGRAGLELWLPEVTSCAASVTVLTGLSSRGC